MSDPEIEKVLSALSPNDRAKLEAYMKAHPNGESDIPEANATGELKFWRKDNSIGTLSLDAKDVWVLLHAMEVLGEHGFEEDAWNERAALLANNVFKTYRGE